MEQIEPNVGGVMLSKRERKREREREREREGKPRKYTKIYHKLPQCGTSRHVREVRIYT